jgi:uncharacterized protein YqeY
MANPTGVRARLDHDIKEAMRSGQKERLLALRQVMAAIKQQEVDRRIAVDDEEALRILDKLAKQRRESIQQFEIGNRQDLVAKERFELDLILSYLPAPLDATAIDQAITNAIAATAAVSIKDLGKVMGLLKGQLQGRADFAAVSTLVKQRLGASS